MITAIVAIVLIAGSMIYYFVFYKPGIEKAEIKQEQVKEFVEKAEIKQEQVKEFVIEYNVIKQEFIDNLQADNEESLKEIRIKLMRLSVPEGCNKCNDIKDKCVNTMNSLIMDMELIKLYVDNDLKVDIELTEDVRKELDNLRSLVINEQEALK
jgi:flagellar basal body-associated protein FliL